MRSRCVVTANRARFCSKPSREPYHWPLKTPGLPREQEAVSPAVSILAKLLLPAVAFFVRQAAPTIVLTLSSRVGLGIPLNESHAQCRFEEPARSSTRIITIDVPPRKTPVST